MTKEVKLTQVKLPKTEKELQEIHELWSISRLNTFAQCPQQYFLQYIAKAKGKDNVYGVLGGIVHEVMEGYYLGTMSREQGLQVFYFYWDLTLKTMSFMSDKVKDKWFANVEHFIKNHFIKTNSYVTKQHLGGGKTVEHNTPNPNYEVLTEIICLYEPISTKISHPKLAVRGYIDMVVKQGNDITILDWKTSSKFSGDKLRDAGRQLLLYKLSIEQQTNVKVNKLVWNMMKYCKLTYKLASGKQSTKIEERCNIGNYDIITVEDYELEYEDWFERLYELEGYISKTINSVSELKGQAQMAYQCKGADFFCDNLCGFNSCCPKYVKSLTKVEVKPVVTKSEEKSLLNYSNPTKLGASLDDIEDILDDELDNML